MSALTGNTVASSYLGLIKTTNNGVLGQQTPSVISDGAGNETPLSLAQEKVIIAKDNQRIDVNDTNLEIKGDTVFISDPTSTNLLQATTASIGIGNNTNSLAFDATNAAFAGAVDFAGATVTGLDSGVQSVVAGTNVTVDNTDPANPVVSASGGGGGGQESFSFKGGYQPWLPGFSATSPSGVYSNPYFLTGYAETTYTLPTNQMLFIPVFIKPGATLSTFFIDINGAGTTMEIALYKSYIGTATGGSKWLYPEYDSMIATGLDVSTTGVKTITGLTNTLATDTEEGMYWIGIQVPTNTGISKYSQAVYTWGIAADIYRMNATKLNTTTVPTGQLTNIGAGITDGHIRMGWQLS